MLRISILFGLLAFASAVKKKVIGANIHNIASIFFTALNAINGGFLFNDDILWCFSVHVSLQKKKQYKDCRETLLHFHFHNSSVYVSSEQNCYCWVFICTLSLFLAFNFHPPAKLAKSEDNMGSEPIWSCFCLSAPNAVWGGFCWMVICFWFFENILLFLLLDGDLVLIILKYFIVAASASAGWWFGFDFLEIFYCFFCWMVICFWFFLKISYCCCYCFCWMVRKRVIDHIDGVICFTQISVLNRNLCRQEIASCDGKFLGHRYADPSDPSLVKNICHICVGTFMSCIYVDMQVLIFDDAGYIAGVQSVLLESDVDLAVNDLTKQAVSLLDLEIGKRDFRKRW